MATTNKNTEAAKKQTKPKADKPKVEKPKVEKAPTIVGVVSANLLNIRSKPSIDSDVVETVSLATRLDLLNENDEWFKVTAPIKGYCMKKFVKYED